MDPTMSFNPTLAVGKKISNYEQAQNDNGFFYKLEVATECVDWFVSYSFVLHCFDLSLTVAESC